MICFNDRFNKYQLCKYLLVLMVYKNPRVLQALIEILQQLIHKCYIIL